MNILLICVGTLKEAYWRDAADEYRKRLGRYCTLTIDEVKEARAPARPSPAEAHAAKDAEGAAILRRVKSESHVIALDVRGAALSSEAFAEKLAALPHAGAGHVTFITGGPLGLAEAVLARADLRLSLSAMTLPHRLARVVLLEQLYRAFTILRGEGYHR
ncbi:MAG: 23S rRNA (pseudouridine(1915)-N(3))-methyltransferase RlmH [Clostridiales Family XIII bacterium]|jgi:23S rRNA (pseudouridine1915-N3)-methyltransferase|nr:23S rRNA (pseudouridine(1915)-N(3))-methyltransferase RlmH [Clostridiales Family XIII bacterium]